MNIDIGNIVATVLATMMGYLGIIVWVTFFGAGWISSLLSGFTGIPA